MVEVVKDNTDVNKLRRRLVDIKLAFKESMDREVSRLFEEVEDLDVEVQEGMSNRVGSGFQANEAKKYAYRLAKPILRATLQDLDGIKRDAGYAFLNWYLTGWQGAFIARQGYYSSVPDTAKANLSANELGYWYEGKAATEDILDPYGAVMDKAGAMRDGGSFEARMGNVGCWNTVMDEERYMVQRWNEFVSA